MPLISERKSYLPNSHRIGGKVICFWFVPSLKRPPESLYYCRVDFVHATPTIHYNNSVPKPRVSIPKLNVKGPSNDRRGPFMFFTSRRFVCTPAFCGNLGCGIHTQTYLRDNGGDHLTPSLSIKFLHPTYGASVFATGYVQIKDWYNVLIFLVIHHHLLC